MKKTYAPSAVLDQINDAISHSQKEGLPLTAIELTHAEWADFKTALTAVPGWEVQPHEFSGKEISYRSIRIHEERG